MYFVKWTSIITYLIKPNRYLTTKNDDCDLEISDSVKEVYTIDIYVCIYM